MDIKRGKPPESIERGLVVTISREEILLIMTNYIKKKMNTDRVRLTEIDITADAQNRQMESITLSGAEIIPLTWTDKTAETAAPTPPTE